VAQVRREAQVEHAVALGAAEVVVTDDGEALDDTEGYRLVVDGIGGPLFGAAVAKLDADGVAVTYGGTANANLELSLRTLYAKGRASIRGLNLYAVSSVTPPATWLPRLLNLARHRRLELDALHVSSWQEVGAIAQGLLDRTFTGKAVLRVD
ncbi:MAG: oxidoreductase, zinc-binding dehydrogenase, partial [Myxococcota bacterium]